MARKTVTLEAISHKDRTSKDGKPYTSCGIKIEGFDGWLNGFGNKQTRAWNKGDEVTIDVETVKKGGNTYYNFTIPDDSVTRAEFDALVARVAKLEEWSPGGKKTEAVDVDGTPLAEIPDPDDSDLPF